MTLFFSIVIPVYNRPDEVRELLQSLNAQDYSDPFDVVLVEDGSTDTSEKVISDFPELDISYFFKENSGPGDSRNFGMRKAKGNFFIIFDSDCVIPSHYLSEVSECLSRDYCDFYGGPDAARDDFTSLQKAINYSMTSLLTTGGIRGKKAAAGTFEPRSFNMGISKKAFEASGGFGRIHPGEDPDLTIRLWKLGFNSRLLADAFVYHKRRISWSKFYTQVRKFGLVRPILNSWHPQTAKITFWFPTLFVCGVLASLIFAAFGYLAPLYLVLSYLMLILIHATLVTRNVYIGLLSIVAVLVQFTGYGLGFLESFVKIRLLKKDARQSFPHLFFD
ncbi:MULTISPECIES: glycosyltransferase [unclassified Leeuwenhoekiella]|uniref:glycosyltransferase n=1 Tax=unclassified Leeuwenhoekiella TaxID=2615029 RepID=UPI000C6B5A94|nr:MULTISPECIES: glycosyltransferase [unclassified Leeuwenhoekiella]MAW94610.1 glycosyl transferase family 2 [Leeuwenhoekiella sp.]MBA82033.1 glycosyl transferase family 2 [Leeuwenhoekiella sp.]|tara:strand:- start:5059 stop:6057 length:999 start_codon:yes stop_codon:yes gene_type:complete